MRGRGRMDGFNLSSTVILTMLALQDVDEHWKNLPILQRCAQRTTFGLGEASLSLGNAILGN